MLVDGRDKGNDCFVEVSSIGIGCSFEVSGVVAGMASQNVDEVGETYICVENSKIGRIGVIDELCSD